MHNETSPSSSGKGRTRTSEPTTARKQDVVWGGHSEASWPPGSGFWRADTVRRARQHSIRHRSMHPSNDHTTQNTRHSHEPARFHQWGGGLRQSPTRKRRAEGDSGARTRAHTNRKVLTLTLKDKTDRPTDSMCVRVWWWHSSTALLPRGGEPRQGHKGASLSLLPSQL